MTKSNHFDGVFYVAQPQKLSTSVSSNIADTYSTDSVLFERGSRKVSSLTTRIGQGHFLGRDLVPNEYAKEARGLSMLISSNLLSM